MEESAQADSVAITRRLLQSAQLLNQAERYAEALSVLQPLLATPSPPSAAAAQGIVSLLGLQRADDAFNLARLLVDTEPDSSEAMRLYAHVQRARGLQADAWSAVQRAVELDPNSTTTLTSYCSIGLAGNRRFRRELLDSSARLVRLAPDDAMSHSYRGAVLARFGGFVDRRRGRASIERALAMEPNNPAVHNLAAVALSSRWDAGAAISAEARSLSLNPQSDVAVPNIVRLFRGVVLWLLVGIVLRNPILLTIAAIAFFRIRRSDRRTAFRALRRGFGMLSVRQKVLYSIPLALVGLVVAAVVWIVVVGTFVSVARLLHLL